MINKGALGLSNQISRIKIAHVLTQVIKHVENIVMVLVNMQHACLRMRCVLLMI